VIKDGFGHHEQGVGARACRNIVKELFLTDYEGTRCELNH
jgi:hypothetical protein